MPMNINNFRSDGLQFGGARPSTFEVHLTAPAGLGKSILPRSRLLVKAASIPPSVMDVVEVGYFGRKIKLDGDRTFPDWQITVLNDEDWALRSMFEAWSNKMNMHISNVRDQDVNPLGYKVDMQVVHYTKAGEISRSYNFAGAFPTVVTDVPLDWDDVNRVTMFNVTIAYDYWEPLEQNSASRAKLYDRYDVQRAGDGVAVRDSSFNNT